MFASAGPAVSAELSAPKGAVILTIDGRIAHGNGDGAARFDLAMLEAMEPAAISTVTPWTDGTPTFVGVDLENLMAVIGAEGQTLVVSALNDYETRVPISDFGEFHPILAYKRDGAYMPVSDKGPLFIVYPYDSDPRLHNDVYYTRSAWQVVHITVE